jgi:nitroreductase
MSSQPPETIDLPPPQISGGMSLLDALARRRSVRAYSEREVPLRLQSDLLWAASGTNRPESGGRTAPSAHNWQEIDIHVVRRDAAYRFDPVRHRLLRVAAGDLRGRTGAQDFVATAPLNLVYVADLSRITATDAVERRFYSAADAAFVAQNVYLCCAATGLASVVRGLIDRHDLAVALGLGLNHRVVLAQSVGYPA